MYRSIAFILLLVISFRSVGQQHPFDGRFPVIDRYFDSLMKEWNIPGLALGIVYKDQLIYGKGYGYRNLEKKLPVETTTLFPIASNTKLFTATAACMLAEDGKLNLYKPVKNYLPAINFSNSELDAKVSLHDMLSHRTGLGRYDGIWINASFSRKEMVSKIAWMKPQYALREGYIYNNMMFVGAGAVLESVTGKSWEEIIRARIFFPLKMTASCFTGDEVSKYGNYALSYYEPDSTHRLLPRTYEAQCEALGPAGTIKSSIEDMSHWMIAQLNGGMYGGVRAFSPDVIAQTLKPNTIADKQGRWPELSNSLYCLGRSIQTYKGHKITSHTGSIDGFYSHLLFIPEKDLGIFVVYNAAEASSLRSVIGLMVADRLLGLSLTPWDRRYRAAYLQAKAKSKQSEDSIKNTQVKGTVPSHPLSDYAGTYNNEIYGNVTVEWSGNNLVFVFRQQRSVLSHFHYDQFVTNEKATDKPDFRLQFMTGNKGDINRIVMRPLGDPQVDFVKTQ